MKEFESDGWIEVFQSGTDYESDLVRNRLDSAGITAVIMSKRDHALNLNVGATSGVSVMVKKEDKIRALVELRAKPVSDSELEEAALASNPESTDSPDASNPDLADSASGATDEEIA